MIVLFLPSWYPNLKSPFDGNFVQNHAVAVSTYCEVKTVFCTSLAELESTYHEVIQHRGQLTEYIIYFRYHKLFLVRMYRKYMAYRRGLKLAGQYDIIHSHVFYYAGLLAVIIGWLENKKVVNTEHSTQFAHAGYIQRFIFKLFGSRIDRHTPVSQDLADRMISYGISPQQVSIISNAIDGSHFKIASPSKSPNSVRFFHLSKYDEPRKNLLGILRVAERLRQHYSNFELEIMGDGDPHWLSDQLLKFPNSSQYIICHRKFEYSTIPEAYQAADAFILFSHFENLPMVLNEAILCGIPVITTSVGGIPEMISKTNGLLVEASDEEALYAAMELFITKKINFDPESVRSTVIHRVDYPAVGSSFFDIYNDLLKH